MKHPAIRSVSATIARATSSYKKSGEMVHDSVKEFDEVDKGKWGYAVCFGTIITFIAGIGHVNSFGLIYNDFMADTHASAKSLTSAHGVFAVMLAIGGLMLNILSKRITLRQGGFVGSIIFVIGSFATISISSINQLPFTFGVLQGIGFGMMVPVSYATLNYYFVKKRTTVMSICKAIQGIILMMYPQLIKMIMSYYGMRGTLFILSGISLNTIPGMLMMKIARRPKTATVIIENDSNSKENEDLLHKAGHSGVVTSCGDVSRENRWRKLRHQIVDILNVKVLKDPVYCNICFGQSFVNFSDLIFFILQPMLIIQYGYDKSDVAMCISVCAGADVLGRFALALLSSIATINTRLLFYVATLFTFIFRIVILQVREFLWVATLTAALGVFRAWIHVTSPLVVASHVSHEDFPGAYAMLMLSAGVINLAFAPIIGLLKDFYEDYVPAFYALTICCIPCLLFWPIEYTLQKK